jgi:hypothetical protein
MGRPIMLLPVEGPRFICVASAVEQSFLAGRDSVVFDYLNELSLISSMWFTEYGCLCHICLAELGVGSSDE